MDIREIPGYDGYFATSFGDILSARSNHGSDFKRTGVLRLKSKRIQNSGYYYVSMSGCKRSVHRLVCLAFHGEPPAHYHCRHINGNKLDNRAENLKWGSVEQNIIDDKITAGEFKLNKWKVSQIRRLLITGWRLSAIAEAYEVSYHTIYYIAIGKTWKGAQCGMNDEFRAWHQRVRN